MTKLESAIYVKYNDKYVRAYTGEELAKKMNDLQQRIDKAIEYIKSHTNNDNCESKNILDLTDRDNILSILKGEDK